MDALQDEKWHYWERAIYLYTKHCILDLITGVTYSILVRFYLLVYTIGYFAHNGIFMFCELFRQNVI